MDAGPLLGEILKPIHKHRLEAILIGNAGAALHGAPVTTLDFDFMFRETPANLRKLKAVSRDLGAVILRPYYPVSKLYRMVNDDRGLQADFMPVIHGVRSFNSCAPGRSGRTSPASPCSLPRSPTSSPANAAPVARATAPCSRCWNARSMKSKSHPKARPRKNRKAARAALAAESDRQLRALIRRRLALPLARRTHFLRVRQPGGGSCL